MSQSNTEAGINGKNVGRIAERIVANELEYRGYRTSDLNREATSANADLLAVKCGKTWQIQVKGSTWDDGWWYGYGHCTEDIIAGRTPMFNRVKDGFYIADCVALVSVKSAKEYSCVLMPVEVAEAAAQLNLDREYRTTKRDGSARKPGKLWIAPDYISPRLDDARKIAVEREIALLAPYRDTWSLDSEDA